jgi:peptidoglycan/LPS O-acetylase OafA/YrhL
VFKVTRSRWANAVVVLLAIVYVVVIVVSWIMYRTIEIPMINFGKALIVRLRAAFPRVAA